MDGWVAGQMQLRREVNMAVHKARFSFAEIKEIVQGQPGSKTGKRKGGSRQTRRVGGRAGRREGEKEEKKRHFQAICVIGKHLLAIFHQFIGPRPLQE